MGGNIRGYRPRLGRLPQTQVGFAKQTFRKAPFARSFFCAQSARIAPFNYCIRARLVYCREEYDYGKNFCIHSGDPRASVALGVFECRLLQCGRHSAESFRRQAEGCRPRRLQKREHCLHRPKERDAPARWQRSRRTLRRRAESFS